MTTYAQFPPDLFILLVEAIPRINKSKKDLLSFFKNIGTPSQIIAPYYPIIRSNPKQISKRDITQEILEKLNSDDSDAFLGIRRKLLQSVINFSAFDTCYPNDIDIAKARISDIKQQVTLKDSITKQEQYLSQLRAENIRRKEQQNKKIASSKSKFESIVTQFNELFAIANPQLRGRSLEIVLNNLFAFFKIGVKDAFCVADSDSGKIYEQIDGVIEINNYLTLVEMKWEKSPVGADTVGRFVGRLIGRHNVDGIIISYSSFTETAIPTAKDGLAYKTIALVDLQDIHTILSLKKDLPTYFSNLIQKVKLYNNPKPNISLENLPDIDFSKYT